ncbi:MAG: fused MFS/spermidine synthase [Thermodesulfovibrionales bacterium]|nr:fused MFS/spermidine synthase [Thermodesulfovibrionales bacterium]
MSEKNMQRVLLLAFCLSGVAALIYEVVWTRALSLILGSTVYALSTMLATFMAGLAIGAYFGGKLADRAKDKEKDLVFYFGLFELGIGLMGFVIVPVIYSLPPLYFKMYKSLHLNADAYFISQFLLSAAIMIIPTTLMGATFPVVSRRLTANIEEMGRKVGDAYSLNTLGAIVGSLSAGFLLIPLVGIKWSSFTAGCINIAVGSLIVLLSGRFSKKAVTAVLVLPLSSYFLTASVSGGDEFSTFYLADRYTDIEHLKEEEGLFRKMYDKDHAEGTVRAYLFKDTFLILQHGGKMEGTGPGDIENTMLLALFPAALFERTPGNMLVIGLGAGVTVRAGKGVVENVSVVEINPGVIEAVARFGATGVLNGVKVYQDDARRLLMTDDAVYDIITSEPSVPSESVSANLFTKEFYEIAAKRLKKGGIFCQWLPGWNLTPADLDVCIKTFASVFENASLWRVNDEGDDFIIVGSMEALPLNNTDILDRIKALNSSVSFFQLKERPIEFVMGPREVKMTAAMPGIPMNTDDKPYIEFAVAKNFLYGKGFRDIRQ